jgi:YidC/Oxa1 family membrane protein insertase
LERRYILFVVLSLAVVLGSQAIRAVFFPASEPPLPEPPTIEQVADAEPAPEAGDAAKAGAPKPKADDVAAKAPETDLPRVRCTIGSLNPDSPARMLVTLTSRGAAIERIELAGSRFHDQDDRSGYLGHLAPVATKGGCRVMLVGAETPADLAGIRSGDVIESLGGVQTPEPAELRKALARTRPGQKVDAIVDRAGEKLTIPVVLDRRPLEVVRPERLTMPVEDAEAEPCDPLSFRLSLEEIDGRKRPDGESSEIAGSELWEQDWETTVESESCVRFTRKLAGGLGVSKIYRIVEAPEGTEPGHRLEISLEFTGGASPVSLAYALDGPTGLPTEGWWYTARVARDWGSLGVRDPAFRFVGQPSRVVSSLTIADASAERPSSAVLDEKPLSFAGVDALYFASALLPLPAAEDGSAESPSLAEVRPLVVGEVPDPARKKLVNVTSRIVSKEITVEPGTTVRQRFGVFAGPKQPDLLSQFGLKGAAMDDLVYYGWFGWVARPMIALLHALHAVIGNYGIAILLLTVMVRGAMFPISRKQALSSQKMQALQPEMKAIAEKYKNEPEKRTKATQELWKKHDYNPAGGCLLVFIQIPIFMGLYRSLATDVELRQAPLFTDAIRWCSNLAAPDMLWDWSKVLPGFLTAPEGWLGPYLNLFPLATIGLFLWQQKLFMPPAVDEQAKVQQQVMKYMMFFMALMFFKVPCGLCLYFIASSLWGIAERIWMPVPQAAPAVAVAATAAVPSPPAREKSAATKLVEAVMAKADASHRQATAPDRRKGRSRNRR